MELLITDKVIDERIDINAYGASFLSYSLEDTEPTVTTYRYGQMVYTGYSKTVTNDANLTVQILFSGRRISDLLDSYNKLTAHLYNCSLKFSQEKDKVYACILKKYSHEFNNATSLTATYEFTAGKYSDETNVIIFATKTTLNIGGALPTPINLYIKRRDGNISDTTILSDIVINGCQFSGITFEGSLFIDSYKRLIINNGTNLATNIDFMKFPEGIGEVVIDMGNNVLNDFEITASYKARWI